MPAPFVAEVGRRAAAEVLERVAPETARRYEKARHHHLWLIAIPPAGMVLVVMLFAFGLAKPATTTGAFPGTVPGIPAVVLDAYMKAAEWSREQGCAMRWSILAAVGKTETGHGTFGGAVADANGDIAPKIYGPPTPYGNAMGPMQFIPSTWSAYSQDGNGDGVGDPHNIFDATRATAAYLCSGGLNLDDEADLRKAFYRYNHSWSYVDKLMADVAFYDSVGVTGDGGMYVSGNGSGGACPVLGGDVKNNWGDARSGGRSHKGNDIGAPTGTPAPAVWDGVITQVTDCDCGLGGKAVWLRADNGDLFYYAHNDQNMVSAGDRVARGQQIATVGHTGNADPSWPHVHFQLHPGGGGPVDPWPTLTAWGCTSG